MRGQKEVIFSGYDKKGEKNQGLQYALLLTGTLPSFQGNIRPGRKDGRQPSHRLKLKVSTDGESSVEKGKQGQADIHDSTYRSHLGAATKGQDSPVAVNLHSETPLNKTQGTRLLYHVRQSLYFTWNRLSKKHKKNKVKIRN